MFLGLDLSTQQLKVLVTDDELAVHDTYSLEFERDLPQYKTTKGVYTNDETGEVVAPLAMWIEALDTVLSQMEDNGFDFAKVKGISGSCQQHGSVFWSNEADITLKSLSSDRSLKEQITDKCFSLQTAPNWQDHSTGEEIKIFEGYVGGADNLADITGSRAHYRFTGTQIRKLLKQQPQVYANTERISLVSSFLASLFAGSIMDIEEADACGMNLYDIKEKDWNDELLAICSMTHTMDGVTDDLKRQKAVAQLRAKLGSCSPVGFNNISKISPYFAQKYAFSPECRIFSFTGDNLATIISLPLNEDELLISLGTSTTVLLVTKHFVPSASYHTFIHPTIPDSFMGMICYCNGSLARETVRDVLNEKFNKPKNDWTLFDQLLLQSHFDEKLGVYFPLGEIVPNRKAQILRARLVNNELEIVESWDEEIDVRAIVQSQALSCRARAAPMLNIKKPTIPAAQDLKFDERTVSKEHLSQRPHKVVFVGGASKNTAIVSKFAEILGGDDSFRFDNPNACALGGAFKASWSVHCEDKGLIGFHEYLLEKFNGGLDKIDTNLDQWDQYAPGLKMLQDMENLLKH